MSGGPNILSTPIEYLKGVGPVRADLLKKELEIHTFSDLLEHFPLRHIDKTIVGLIKDIRPDTDTIQVAGTLLFSEIVGAGRSKRLVAQVRDRSGILELTWFQGISWVTKLLEPGTTYLIFGKTSFFNGKPQIVHPEIEVFVPAVAGGKPHLEPVYPSTEKLKARGLNGRQLAKLTAQLFQQIRSSDIPENIPEAILQKYQLTGRANAYRQMHFPANPDEFKKALDRLKFEEFFMVQVRMNLVRLRRHRYSKGVAFEKVGELFNQFFHHYLPFSLTGAQKRVIKEIRNDTGHGRQMNRLLQGDVGSGKTIVALMSMLLAADNGFQSCFMAPTEILVQQHYAGLQKLLKDLPVKIALLTGSTKAARRKEILEGLLDGSIQIVVGTHAVIEERVRFSRLGLVVIDEQHRFGVEQRARLWEKADIPPHVLVMTATPIPRTLAMTAFGDLDYSVMDELPPGRQPILTVHRNEMARASVYDFVRSEIDKGRQAYFIYPLIEESNKVNYEDLLQGYEQVKSFFPEPKFRISMVHGKMPAEQKETNMHRFVTGDTQVMVSTTVIEVGVDVPNATVMVIESAEKFGLSQLHQLRGRVGRGSEKSFCILLTGSKASKEALERIQIMTQTQDGFVVAEKDLAMRGPGEIEGTRQSGALNTKVASIVHDRDWLEKAKIEAEELVAEDLTLELAKNLMLRQYLSLREGKTAWSRIS
ncbi:MAG: ATP-dependent DNA helicase RecG [Chitinophagaceae bacterium]|nr:ATP-dependent DNA helicase RecG [Chitinophagaceae bacterium]MCA6466381.1 ATP-dependent DNA helicase RecG [Chitinophagaceae bacterium]MCA6500221.1 ATP-dependent DNA helicase RecG [Chitinophagaceae bacterium]